MLTMGRHPNCNLTIKMEVQISIMRVLGGFTWQGYDHMYSIGSGIS